MEEKYKTLADYLESVIGIVAQMGLKVISLTERHAKLLMPLQKNMNHMGTMYAGSLFTLGEMMGGAIFVASFDINKYYPIAKEIQIRYRRPATTDITVEASFGENQIKTVLAVLEEKGKSDVPMKFDLIDAHGEIVAIITAMWQIRKE